MASSLSFEHVRVSSYVFCFSTCKSFFLRFLFFNMYVSSLTCLRRSRLVSQAGAILQTYIPSVPQLSEQIEEEVVVHFLRGRIQGWTGSITIRAGEFKVGLGQLPSERVNSSAHGVPSSVLPGGSVDRVGVRPPPPFVSPSPPTTGGV